MKLRSIGARLTLRYSAAFALALALLGGGMWLTVRQSLYHAIDESLRDRVEGVRRFIEDHKTRLFLDEVKEEFRAHGDLFQVLDENGQLVHRAQTLSAGAVPVVDAPSSAGRFDDVNLNGEELRFLTQPVHVDGHDYVVQAAASLHDLRQGLAHALWVLVPMLPLGLAIAAAGGYWMSRRALGPVDEITRAARQITAASLSQRLTVPHTGDELERLSQTLNEMIERLEQAFKRISQFTADASHELRTPLAVMRTTAEVTLRGPEDPREQRAALEQMLAELERMSHLVENLLVIAKADSGEARLQKQPVDLVATVQEACVEADVLARTKGVRLEAALPPAPLRVAGDAHALRRLFLILLDNAVKYTPAGGRSEVTLTAADGYAVGSVRDTGIGIPAEDLPHVFERFYRVDRARARGAAGGTGLGLAIGRWIAEAHGGTISVQSELDRGSVFSVRLPLA